MPQKILKFTYCYFPWLAVLLQAYWKPQRRYYVCLAVCSAIKFKEMDEEIPVITTKEIQHLFYHIFFQRLYNLNVIHDKRVIFETDVTKMEE